MLLRLRSLRLYFDGCERVSVPLRVCSTPFSDCVLRRRRDFAQLSQGEHCYLFAEIAFSLTGFLRSNWFATMIIQSSLPRAQSQSSRSI